MKFTKTQKKILALKKAIINKSVELRKKTEGMPVTQGQFDRMFEAECRPLKDELEYLETRALLEGQNKLVIATWALAIVGIFSLLVACWIPRWERKQERKDGIISLYRSIVANEDIHITNLNNIDKFKNSSNISDLPESYIDYKISGNLHELLQGSFGITNYRFLLYYLGQTSFLNETKKEMTFDLIVNGPDSLGYRNAKRIYLDTLDYLDREATSTKFNYLKDTECLLYFFIKSFPYLMIDKRDQKLDCSDESLYRKFYHFGLIAEDTPEWEKLKLIEAVKARGDLDISGRFR